MGPGDVDAGSLGRSAGEEPSLTLKPDPVPPPESRGRLTMSSHTLYGTIIIIDIDRMGETIEERGWSQWRPNQATGQLSRLADALVRKWNALLVYGLDWDRGTEEVIIEVPLAEAKEIVEDLVNIAQEMCKAGVTVTIAARTLPLIARPARNRREAYQGPRRLVKRELEKYKRRGGGIVVVDGEIVARLSPSECAVGEG